MEQEPFRVVDKRPGLPCPGCGGRNLPEAVVCEWCARPFVAPPRRFEVRWWQVVVGLVAFVGVAGLLLLGVLNASREPARGRAPTPTAAVTVGPAGLGGASPAAQTAGALAAPPAASALPVGSAPPPTPTPVTSPTPEPARPAAVRVANTGGVGVYLRREPALDAQRIVAWPDRTVLQVLGPEQVVDGQSWLPVQDPRGNRGWVPSQYTEAVEPEPAVPRP
jgi:hypothetical protein